MAEPVTAYLALGSNLGDRAGYLNAAITRLRSWPGVDVTKVSTFLETDPVGGPGGQGKYLNAAAEVHTTLAPLELMRALLQIETALGRVRTERFGPRTIDLDVLLYGLEVVQSDELTVPHPRMHERAFVLAPLVEIAPLAVHPILESTVADLLKRLSPAVTRELSGQTAVVTGSTSGIGRAIALALADAGANVVIHGRRSQSTAEIVVQECKQLHVDARCVMADLRDEKQCARLVENEWKQEAVDIWINNAGADTLTGEAAKWPFERKLEELWAVDVRAAMLLSRDIGARMKQRGRGVIVNMGWDQADTGMAGDSGQLFGAVKGAVMAFTKSLALELAPEVRVNCIAPGWIKTAWGEHASQVWQQRVLDETPLKRWGTPEDVADAVRWLVSPAARFITGQIVRVNGGAL
jgi:2-amino-4-hydroxy-6-hydroxymethyldihydropteridine diphosphokinase